METNDKFNFIYMAFFWRIVVKAAMTVANVGGMKYENVQFSVANFHPQYLVLCLRCTSHQRHIIKNGHNVQ